MCHEELIVLLQKDIDSLIHWFQRNKLTVNINKSCSMLIGSKQRICQYSGLEKLGLKINGVELANKLNKIYIFRTYY